MDYISITAQIPLELDEVLKVEAKDKLTSKSAIIRQILQAHAQAHAQAHVQTQTPDQLEKEAA